MHVYHNKHSELLRSCVTILFSETVLPYIPDWPQTHDLASNSQMKGIKGTSHCIPLDHCILSSGFLKEISGSPTNSVSLELVIPGFPDNQCLDPGPLHTFVAPSLTLTASLPLPTERTTLCVCGPGVRHCSA